MISYLRCLKYASLVFSLVTLVRFFLGVLFESYLGKRSLKTKQKYFQDISKSDITVIIKLALTSLTTPFFDFRTISQGLFFTFNFCVIGKLPG